MKSPKFTLRGFKRPREAVRQALGELENAVMEEVWRRGEASVHDVHGTLGKRAAYTTLMTTLDRLYRKNLLDRRKESRAFIYIPRISREEFEQTVAREVIEGLLGNAPAGQEPMLASFVEAVSGRDHELLDELERLIKEKRRKLRREGKATE